jgi:hypothetical protein
MSSSGRTIRELLRRASRHALLRTGVAAGIAAAAVGLTAATLDAQPPGPHRYFPLDQNTPPGVAGQWSTAGLRGATRMPQLIRVEVPGDEGEIGFFTRPGAGATMFDAPATAAVQVGGVYRLKISGMEDYPGVELYPSVELLDRLHPPRGREAEFPIPITFTAEEIELVLQGRMITKVIYLEQPDRAAPARNSNVARTRIAGTRENPLALADEAGRPMAIVRLGSRAPDPHSHDPDFYGNWAPIQFPADLATRTEEARR